MKTTYIKPQIKVKDIKSQSILAASGETLVIMHGSMDNDQALSKEHDKNLWEQAAKSKGVWDEE